MRMQPKYEVFQAWRIDMHVRHYDPQRKKITKKQEKAGSLALDDSDESLLIEQLLEYGVEIGPFFLMNLTNNPGTWAAVFFSKIIPNSDEVLEIRGEFRSQIGFAAYGPAEVGMQNPPIGAMVIRSASALQALSSRHEVYRRAWEALKDKSPDLNWVAVVEI